jgi:hypothetical protein
VCLPHRGDPGCAEAHVTILSPDGSSLSLTCDVFLSSPLSAHPIGFSDCHETTATGRFEGVTVFDSVALGNRRLLMFQISDASTVRVELGFDWPTASKFISEGTLAATVSTLVTGTTCDPGQPILAVDFNGALPRIGAVSGSISATCPAS